VRGKKRFLVVLLGAYKTGRKDLPGRKLVGWGVRRKNTRRSIRLIKEKITVVKMPVQMKGEQ